VGLGVRAVEDLQRLRFRRLHAVLRGSLGLGDALLRSPLRLRAQALGLRLGGRDELADALGPISRCRLHDPDVRYV
jgi:hypothetical protein